MKTEVEKTVIPEKVIEKTWYISSDGRKFDREEPCKRWEEHLEVMSHPVMQTRDWIYLWPDERGASMYYIKSEEDYNFLKQHVIFSTLEEDDFPTMGPGFYVWYTDSYDAKDIGHLLNIDYYIHRLRTELDSFEDEIKHRQINILA